jgi:hypothetical protein
MITNLLGKILFPHLPPWQQMREAKTMLGVTMVALFFSGIIALVILWRNRLGR